MFEHANSALVVRFGKALAGVQNVAKTQTADTGKYTYSYADLGDVLDEVKRALAEYGLTVCQVPGFADGLMTVTTMVLPSTTIVSANTHDGAEGFIRFDPMGLKMPGDAQAYGSALTYARRYSLLTIFGIAPEDDDGRAATVAATTQPGRRTEAERLIREHVGGMDQEQAKRFASDFKERFGSTLTNLPVPKHGDALAFTREWLADQSWTEEAGDDAAGGGIEGQQ